MKIISFNINGLRARLHQLQALIDAHSPDVIGLQEIKVDNAQFPVSDVEAMGYHVVYHGQNAHYVLVQTHEPFHLSDGRRRCICSKECIVALAIFIDLIGHCFKTPIFVLNNLTTVVC